MLYTEGAKSKRMIGINGIKNVNGMTILDFGGNDGFISNHLLENGAKIAHVFDMVPSDKSVRHKNLIYKEYKITSWKNFVDDNIKTLLPKYDIILFLGVYHHLKEKYRDEIFNKLIELADKYFCFRCRNNMFPGLVKQLPKNWKKEGKFVWRIS